LRHRLSRFGAAFHLPVGHVTARMLQAWLDSRDVSNRSKLNDLRHVASLLRFAVRRQYAPRDLLDELEAVERPEITPSPTLIFTPDELRELRGVCSLAFRQVTCGPGLLLTGRGHNPCLFRTTFQAV
jgi:hypothetical protein